jgi:hypothetical protein
MSCTYCLSGSKHPHFVYLLSDKRCTNNPAKHKVVPYIGLASNPFMKLCAHNRQGRQFGLGSQLTKLGAGHYQLEMVYGPIWRGGRHYKNVCRKKSRKIVSRMLHFCDYAYFLQSRKHAGFLYVRDEELVRSLYLRRARATGVTRSSVE